MMANKEKAKMLKIIHFNDVYNVEPGEKEPVGGAARFKTKIQQLRDELHSKFGSKEPLVLFSGDALGPSKISSIFKGEQMIPILNALDVNTAVFGNHDFVDVTKSTKFPWLMSNVVDKTTDRPLGEGLVKRIITWEGRMIGMIGLVEYEWLETLPAEVPLEDLDYTDYVKRAQELVPQLIAEGCELIIALTHMRMHNDTRLAESVDGIDIILGGHDHFYAIKKVNGINIVKSDCEFRAFSEITIEFTSGKPYYTIVPHTITSDIKEDEKLAAVVSNFLSEMEEKMKIVIGQVHCSLEGRDTYVRTQETNLGNFISDIVCRATKAECAIVNSGVLRSNIEHEAGNFRLKDLSNIFGSFEQSLILLSITGNDLLEALENGVSKYPQTEGRFPLVSGLKFTFDPSLPSGKRIIEGSVYVAGKPLQLDKTDYKLGTNEYLAEGKDGYNMLKYTKRLVNVGEGTTLFTAVRNFFADVANPKKKNNLKKINMVVADEIDGPIMIEPKVEGRINMVKQKL